MKWYGDLTLMELIVWWETDDKHPQYEWLYDKLEHFNQLKTYDVSTGNYMIGRVDV